MLFESPTSENLADATSEQLADLAAICLEKLEAGRQAFPLFKQLRRLVVMSTVELVPLRTDADKPQVLLGERPTGPEEPWWGGMLNLPGSVLLPNEPLEDYHDLETPSDRILDTEFGRTVRRTSGVHVFDRGLTTGDSGRENKTWGWAEVELIDDYDKPAGGDFYDVEEVIANPPENLVEGHSLTLLKGFQAYQEFRDRTV